MKKSILISLILIFFFVISAPLVNAELSLFQQKSFSKETAERFFIEKKWEEALKAYKAILLGLKGEDLDRANDRLGDIYFFLGHYDNSKTFYTKVNDAVLKREGKSLGDAIKLFLDEKYEAAEGPTYDLDKQTKLSNLIVIKLSFIDAFISSNKSTVPNQLEELKLKSNEFIFLYHKVLSNEGFNLNEYSYNSLTDKLNEKRLEIKTIIDEINKITGRDTTKTRPQQNTHKFNKNSPGKICSAN